MQDIDGKQVSKELEIYNFLFKEYKLAKDDYDNNSFVAPKSMYHIRVSMRYELFSDTSYYSELETLIDNVYKDYCLNGEFSKDSVKKMVAFLVRWGLLKGIEDSKYSVDIIQELIDGNKPIQIITMEDLKDIIEEEYRTNYEQYMQSRVISEIREKLDNRHLLKNKKVCNLNFNKN